MTFFPAILDFLFSLHRFITVEKSSFTRIVSVEFSLHLTNKVYKKTELILSLTDNYQLIYSQNKT